jgi:hypothetical protein
MIRSISELCFGAYGHVIQQIVARAASSRDVQFVYEGRSANVDCYKSDKQITKNDKDKCSGDTRFNVENIFQHRRGKNRGRQPAKLHYIGE